VARGARHKLGRLRTLEGVEVGESARVMWPNNPHFCEQAMRAPYAHNTYAMRVVAGFDPRGIIRN